MKQQPNQYAAGLRVALDIVKDRRDLVIRLNDLGEDATIKGWTGGSLFQLNQLIDTLSDQLLDAGGFLGAEPEPEDFELTAEV